MEARERKKVGQQIVFPYWHIRRKLKENHKDNNRASLPVLLPNHTELLPNHMLYSYYNINFSFLNLSFLLVLVIRDTAISSHSFLIPASNLMPLSWDGNMIDSSYHCKAVLYYPHNMVQLIIVQ